MHKNSAFTIIMFMSTGTEQCTIFRFPPLQKLGLASAHVLYMVHIQMVVLSNPGTCGTRKCSSWCADIHKDPEYKHPEIQHSQKSKKFKNPKTQKSKNQKIQISKKSKKKTFYIYGFLIFLDFWIFGFCFLDFWIFGFLGFWIFGFLLFVFYTCVFNL